MAKRRKNKRKTEKKIISKFPDVKNIFQYKKSETAVLLGSGPSINEISESQWGYIRKCDSWALNNWIYHPTFVPNFYHLELRSFNFEIFKEHMKKKRKLYAQTKFIIPANKPRATEAVSGHKYIFTYDFIQSGHRAKRKPPLEVNVEYEMDKHKVTNRYWTTISVVLDLLYKFNYSTIYLYGVDLHTSEYFWADRPECEPTHYKTNKNLPSDHPHSIYFIKDFIIGFNKKFLKPKGIKMFVGTKKTALYPDIPYKEILQ